MANEFVAKNGLISQNNSTITGSLIVTGGITGSLFGTASWSTNTITSSYPIAVSSSTIYSVIPTATSLGKNNAILLGADAGTGTTTIYNSNFIGYAAGQSATNAYQSNFIGVYAGAEATKADNSNFIGLFTGYKAVSASFSTLIGWQAGYTSDPLTSIGSNNIIIGTNITLPTNTRNSINLGGIIFATGSYSTIAGNPYSGSQNNIGRVGINKVTPIYTLDVSGSGNYSNGLTVTGSIIATSFTGSLLGTASYANQALSSSFASTVPASGVIGLNLTQIATSSFTASVTPTQFTITSASITEFTVVGTGVTIGNVITDAHNVTGSLNVTGSIVGNLTGTASFATSASWAPSSNPFPFTGSALITGSLGITGSLSTRAQGALSTDVAFRVRNSANTANLTNINGNGGFKIGLDNAYHISLDPTSPSLRGQNGATVAWQLSPWTGEHGWLTSNATNQNLIGIGTTSPTDKLHVYNTINDYRIRIGVGAGTPSDESCGIRFTTTWAGTSFGADAANLVIRTKGTSNSTTQRTALEFRMNALGTSALRASLTGQSNFLLQSPTEDTNDIGVIYIPNGTAPTSSLTDGYKQYSADVNGVNGAASPHFRTEDGSILWLGTQSRLFNVTASNLIVSSSATIGFTSSVSTENTLTLGPPPAGGTGEGGQLGLAASGGLYTSASMIDTWQNQFRILRGTNASSNAGLVYVDLQTGNTNFVGAVTASAYSGLPNDYLYVTRNTTQTIGSGTWADRDIIFNNSVVSKGISYNTSTGLATLTAGKVYRITSRLAWSAAGAYLLEFSCYNSSNTQLGPSTQIVQSTNGSNNISDGTLDFIYAPGSNVDIKIRTTANTTALTGESIRGDLNTQLIIQQIA